LEPKRQEKYPNLLAEPPRETRSLAGKKSVEAKRKQRDMRMLVQHYLHMPMYHGAAKLPKNYEGIPGTNIEVLSAMVVAQIQKALRGDTKAFNAILEVVRLSSSEGQEVSHEINNQIMNDTIEALRRHQIAEDADNIVEAEVVDEEKGETPEDDNHDNGSI